MAPCKSFARAAAAARTFPHGRRSWNELMGRGLRERSLPHFQAGDFSEPRFLVAATQFMVLDMGSTALVQDSC